MALAGENNFPPLAHLENEGSIITHVKLLAQSKSPISISSSYRCYSPTWKKSRESLQLGEGAAGTQAQYLVRELGLLMLLLLLLLLSRFSRVQLCATP